MLTFAYAFLDAALMGTMNGEFQRTVANEHMAEVFGNVNVWGHGSIVIGALLVGKATEIYSYSLGSVIVCIPPALALGYLAFRNYIKSMELKSSKLTSI